MSFELLKDKIVLDQKMGKEISQSLIEGDIIVPDIKPDMAVVLQTNAKIAIDKVEVLADKVNYTGKFTVNVLYLAKTADKPVHSISISNPFDDFIHMEGLNSDMWVEMKPIIANVDFKMLNDRKLNYRAVVDMHLEATATDEHMIVSDISDVPENQLKKTSVKLNRRIEYKEDHFAIKDELSVPSGKPNIREILQSNVSIANKDVRVSTGKVAVTGELVVTTLYKGDEDSSLIEFLEHEIPFNGSVEVPDAKDDMFADISLQVNDLYIQVRPDADGEDRMMDVEVSLGAMVKVNAQENVQVLEDAYCINKDLDISKMPIRYSRLVCRNKNQSPIKEVVQIGDGCPDMLQIFRVTGDVVIDDLKVFDDKVSVEGIIQTGILYVAESDETPLYSYDTVIPFRQIIETKGAIADCDVSLETSIDHVSFNMLSGREVEVRFLLSFNTQVLEDKEMNMVTDIEFADMDKSKLDSMAGMTIYVVQQEDNLWKIAKKYNTSMDDILNVNELEAPDKVYPGQKLLILKNII